jgi:hypothetical protein
MRSHFCFAASAGLFGCVTPNVHPQAKTPQMRLSPWVSIDCSRSSWGMKERGFKLIPYTILILSVSDHTKVYLEFPRLNF